MTGVLTSEAGTRQPAGWPAAVDWSTSGVGYLSGTFTSGTNELVAVLSAGNTVEQVIEVSNVAPSPTIISISEPQEEGTAITVTATATDPAGVNDTLTYTWSVLKGDVAYASASGVDMTEYTFTPDDNGSYAVSLTVSDEDGGSATVESTVEVSNVAPRSLSIVSISEPQEEGTAITVTATATDPAGVNDTLTYTWSVLKGDVAYASASGVDMTEYTFTPDDNGSYAVSLTVSDEDGGSATVGSIIAVSSVAPSVAISGATAVDEGTSYSLTLTASDPVDDTISAWEVNWGDGIETVAADYGLGGNSVRAFNSTTGLWETVTIASHVYPDGDTVVSGGPTVRTITATATDEDGGPYVASPVGGIVVTVSDVAPTTTLAGNATSAEASSYQLTLGLVQDPGTDAVSAYFIDWGDGSDPDGDGQTGQWIQAAALPGNRIVSHVYADDSTPVGPTRVIKLGLLNEDGFFADVTTKNVTVTNAAPTVAQFNGPSTANESAGATFVFLNPTDVSAADRAVGYTYRLLDGTGAVLAETTVASTASVVSLSIPGSLLSDGPRDLTVIGRIVDKDGGHTDYTRPLHIDNVAPNVNAGPDRAIDAGTVFGQVGTFSDPGTDLWTAAVDYDWHSGDTDVVPLALNGKEFALNHVYAAPGTYTIHVTVFDDDGGAGTDDVVVTVSATTFQVVDFHGSQNGFDVMFNGAADLSRLNLYTGTTISGAADVTLVGQSTGAVRGSLVWDANTNTATFIKTGGPLAPDTYTMTLFSRSDGWTDGEGHLLDGDANSIDGGDFVRAFTVDAPATPVLTLPDFARGPGQSVDTDMHGTGLGVGLPVHISEADGVLSVEFELNYNPALLEITDVAFAAGTPSNWWLSVNNDVAHGQLFVSAAGSEALLAGSRDVFVLTATVPETAPYAASEALRLVGVAINGMDGQADVAIHKVAYFGDTTGENEINGRLVRSDDASPILRIGSHLQNGFDAYPLTDPAIIADIDGNGRVGSEDASYILRKSSHLPTPEIPPVPEPLPGLVLAGVDPVVSIPTGIVALPGSIVDVPVDIEGPDDAGVQYIDLQFTYDTRLLDLSNSDVRLADLTAGWNLLVNVDDSRGLAYVSAWGAAPLATGTGGILDMSFHVPVDVSGTSPITVAASPNGGLNSGALILTPVDGSVVVTKQTASRAVLRGRLNAVHDAALRELSAAALWLEELDGGDDAWGLGQSMIRSKNVAASVDAVFGRHANNQQ